MTFPNNPPGFGGGYSPWKPKPKAKKVAGRRSGDDRRQPTAQPVRPAPRPAPRPAAKKQAKRPVLGPPAPKAAAPTVTAAAAAPPVPVAGPPAAPGTPTAPGAVMTGPEVDAQVRAMFGDVAGFLTEPELGPILRQAAAEGWEGPRLFGALQQTKFWKTKADDERKFVMLNALDPATARAMVDARASDMRALAQQLGVPVQPDTLRQVATASVRLGWNQNQMRESVTAGFRYTPGVGGQAGQSAAELKKIAGDYLVPVSDQALSDWVGQIVQGKTDLESFRAYAVEQAKSLFPSMAAALDKGVTVAQYADPYKQIAARELELNPEQIDLSQPKFRKMLDKVDANGNRTTMTLTESAEYLRTQPEWQQTRAANERAAAVTENILKTFGAVG